MKTRHHTWNAFLCATLLAIPATAQSWSAGRMGLDGIGQPRSVAYGNGVFVASYTPANNTTSIATSSDGTTWSYATGNNFGVGGTVVFHNDQFYYASGSSAYRSSDGVSWTRLATIPGGPFASAEIAATDGATYLFGSNSTGQPSPLVTTDFQTWSYAGSLPTSPPLTKVQGYTPYFGSGRFLIAYTAYADDLSTFVDKLASSADGGATWTEIPGIQPDRDAIAYGNGRFVVLGSNRIHISTDGLNFTTHHTLGGLPASTSNLTFAGGRFIAYQDAVFYASTDGLTWNSFGSVSPAYAQSYIHLTYGKGRYVGLTRRFLPEVPGHEEVILVAAALAPPQITGQPRSLTAPLGGSASFSVEVDDPTGLSYVWYKDAVPLPGATTATLTLSELSEADGGAYRCVLTNAQGTATTQWAVLTVGPALVSGHLTNLSVNTLAGSGEQTLTAGIVLNGTGTKPVLIRGIGPTLATFLVPNPVADPSLTLFRDSAQLATNNNWSGEFGASLGAFPLPEGSADAVLSTSLGSGLYTAQLINPAPLPGNALIEVYDAEAGNQSLQLANLSARVALPVGSSVTVGFVIGGDTPMNIMIRAIGPGLAQWISGTLADPRLTLFKNSAELRQNDNWAGDDGRAVGAFPLTSGSLDSIIVTSLAPGLYTTRAESATSGGTGIVLLELYVLP